MKKRTPFETLLAKSRKAEKIRIQRKRASKKKAQLKQEKIEKLQERGLKQYSEQANKLLEIIFREQPEIKVAVLRTINNDEHPSTGSTWHLITHGQGLVLYHDQKYEQGIVIWHTQEEMVSNSITSPETFEIFISEWLEVDSAIGYAWIRETNQDPKLIERIKKLCNRKALIKAIAKAIAKQEED
jgi:hypothetical protein